MSRDTFLPSYEYNTGSRRLGFEHQLNEFVHYYWGRSYKLLVIPTFLAIMRLYGCCSQPECNFSYWALYILNRLCL